MKSQMNRGMPQQLNTIKMSLNRTNEKLDVLIELLQDSQQEVKHYYTPEGTKYWTESMDYIDDPLVIKKEK